MEPTEPRNRKNGAWKLKDDEKTCNNAEGSQNPENQSTLAVGKQSNGKSRVNIPFRSYNIRSVKLGDSTVKWEIPDDNLIILFPTNTLLML
jgi:hypothetical protein